MFSLCQSLAISRLWLLLAAPSVAAVFPAGGFLGYWAVHRIQPQMVISLVT